jgi:hypothetical protein
MPKIVYCKGVSLPRRQVNRVRELFPIGQGIVEALPLKTSITQILQAQAENRRR